MARILFGLALVTLIHIPGGPVHASSTLADCNSNDVERVVSGCSSVIDEGNLTGSTLAIAYSRRSDAYVAQGRLDEAIADREKARELDPANEVYERRLLETYEMRGDAHLASGRFRDAIEDYSIVLDGGLVSTGLLEKRSQAHVQAGDIVQAIADLEGARELSGEKAALERAERETRRAQEEAHWDALPDLSGVEAARRRLERGLEPSFSDWSECRVRTEQEFHPWKRCYSTAAGIEGRSPWIRYRRECGVVRECRKNLETGMLQWRGTERKSCQGTAYVCSK